MTRSAPAVLLAAVAIGLTLTSCTPRATTPTASPTTSAPPASPSPTPSPTASPAAVAHIPTDCADVGTAATRAATVDGLNLQGDGTGFVRPTPPGAALALGCDWIVGDATGVLLLVYEVDPAAAAAYVPGLSAQGYACGPGSDGSQVCTMTTPNSMYPVDTLETIVWRDTTWTYMSTSNVDGTALMSDLQTSIWGA